MYFVKYPYEGMHVCIKVSSFEYVRKVIFIMHAVYLTKGVYFL